MSKPPNLRNHKSLKKSAVTKEQEETNKLKTAPIAAPKSPRSKSPLNSPEPRDQSPTLKLTIATEPSVISLNKGDPDPMRQSIEQMYYKKINEFLQMTIENPLNFYCPATTAEDWDNVPETSAQIILYL